MLSCNIKDEKIATNTYILIPNNVIMSYQRWKFSVGFT
jgi:hypothetical protein